MDIVVVELKGGIADFPLLIQTVDGLLADGERRLVLDLGTLPFMNSSALGYLIKVRQHLGERGGSLALARVQQAIRNILAVTNLESLFALHETVEGAVAALHAERPATQIRRHEVLRGPVPSPRPPGSRPER
jgi:anti-sigma B factor antagonist